MAKTYTCEICGRPLLLRQELRTMRCWRYWTTIEAGLSGDCRDVSLDTMSEASE
jgi:hypothetical protein